MEDETFFHLAYQKWIFDAIDRSFFVTESEFFVKFFEADDFSVNEVKNHDFNAANIDDVIF